MPLYTKVIKKMMQCKQSESDVEISLSDELDDSDDVINVIPSDRLKHKTADLYCY